MAGGRVVFGRKPQHANKVCAVWGYGITDCGVKWGECPVGRGLSVDLAVVMIEYGCSSVSCICGFLLKSLNDDFLGVDCLVVSLNEQLAILRRVEHLG